MIDIDLRIAGAEQAVSLRDAGLDPALTAVLERVAPIHRALWWPAHDSANRAWVAANLPLLRAHGRSIADGVARAFRTRWPNEPIRVDLVAYGKGGGAYTTNRPSHMTMPSLDESYREARGLEMLFHESLHTIDDVFSDAARTAATAQGKRVPSELGHVLIFYTAGEVTRQRIPGHVPYAEWVGLWSRVARWNSMLPMVRAHWQPYLEGRGSFDDAINGLIATIPADPARN
jgi:hypothetical protein